MKRLHSTGYISRGANGTHYQCRHCGTFWPWITINGRISNIHCPKCCGVKFWCRKKVWVQSVLTLIVEGWKTIVDNRGAAA